MLSEEQVAQIKQQIIQQINSTFPEDKKQFAIQQVESMNNEQLESFLAKNNLIKDDANADGVGGRGIAEENAECVFCSIVSGKIKSCVIGEDSKAIAVLEINPISEGHALVIPKEHAKNTPKGALAFAEKISEKIKKKLKPKKVEISKSKLFGHEVINLLPVYTNETFDSERKHTTPDELEIVKEKLEKKVEKISKPKREKIKEKLWLPKRIP